MTPLEAAFDESAEESIELTEQDPEGAKFDEDVEDERLILDPDKQLISVEDLLKEAEAYGDGSSDHPLP